MKLAVCIAVLTTFLLVVPPIHALGIGELLTARQIMTGNLTNGSLIVDSNAAGAPIGPIGVRNKGDAGLIVTLTPSNSIKGRIALSETQFVLNPNQTKQIHFKAVYVQSGFYTDTIGVTFAHVSGQVGTTSLSSELFVTAIGAASNPPKNATQVLNSLSLPQSTNGTGGASSADVAVLQIQISNLTAKISALEGRMSFFESFLNSILNAICSVNAFSICPGGGTGSSCTSECTLSQSVCDGSGARKICGNFDSDPCLEFSPSTACASGQTCQNGTCSSQQQCTNQQVCQNVCPTLITYKDCRARAGCSWSFFTNKCTGTVQACTMQQVCN